MLKYRQAFRAAWVLSRDPFDFFGLTAMTDAVSLSWFVQWWYRRLLKDVPPETLSYLRELTKRPFNSEELARMPEGSLGHRYTKFLRDNGIRFEGYVEAVPGLVETFEKDWVTHRFFKTHDILHCVAGFDTSMPGEMGLQMFDIWNLREPYGIGAILSTPFMIMHYGQPVEMLREIVRGFQVGASCDNLFFAPFEDMWEWDYNDVRAYLGLTQKKRWRASPASPLAKRGEAAPPMG